MPESVAVTQTLETLRNADNSEDIGGHERLAETQNHLVDLLNYLEAKEGYSLFVGERKKCGRLQQASATPLTPQMRRSQVGGAAHR